MKKTMMMTLAVLSMVLGSFAVVQPVKAVGNCELIQSTWWGCHSYLCPNGCTVIVCLNLSNPTGPYEVTEECD
ncbi:hypothetical protein [Algoriphagus namhaensis]